MDKTDAAGSPRRSTGNGPDGSFRSFLKAYGGLFDEKPDSGQFIRIAWLETPLGPMLAGADSEALRFLDFSDGKAIEAQIASLRRTSGYPIARGDCTVLERLRMELDAYFAGKLRSFSVPVASPGTPFQALVWRALSEIPYGETRSYSELAVELGLGPGAGRAVGHANGLNRLAVLVPCHRVIAADGGLGGYGGGLWRKLRLLERENAVPLDARAEP